MTYHFFAMRNSDLATSCVFMMGNSKAVDLVGDVLPELIHEREEDRREHGGEHDDEGRVGDLLAARPSDLRELLGDLVRVLARGGLAPVVERDEDADDARDRIEDLVLRLA